MMILQKLQTIPFFIQHFLSEVDEHSLQSPFLYSFYTNCIKTSLNGEIPAELENMRQGWLQSDEVVVVEDHGAGSRLGGRKRRKISDIARVGISSGNTCLLTCLLLTELVRFFRPRLVIELGTSLGISAMSLGFDRQTPVITIEAAEALCDLAQSHFRQHGYHNIRLERGPIDECLPMVLAQEELNADLVFIDANHRSEALIRYVGWLKTHLSEHAVIVVDDIRWSADMYAGWKELCADEAFQLSLDLRALGILIKRPELVKRHYFLHFH
jgi:predicted O-methyltransferase YrrM